MKVISLRDFQLKPSKYLSELPLVLTQYGKPILSVNKYTESVNKSQTTIEESVNGKEVAAEKISENLEEPPVGWCEVHFEKGKEYPLIKITWEDENGLPIIKEKWACPDCVKKYEHIGRGRVFYL